MDANNGNNGSLFNHMMRQRITDTVHHHYISIASCIMQHHQHEVPPTPHAGQLCGLFIMTNDTHNLRARRDAAK
jgi:hypothetical protein